MRQTTLKHEFVEYIPDDLKEGTVYISIPFTTAAHKCCCRCGNEVVTPLSPTDWKLIFDGDSISLEPSIGNWSFPCQSHYWITRNKVKWARPWSRKEIESGRRYDQLQKDAYFESHSDVLADENRDDGQRTISKENGRFRRLKDWWQKSAHWF